MIYFSDVLARKLGNIGSVKQIPNVVVAAAAAAAAVVKQIPELIVAAAVVLTSEV